MTKIQEIADKIPYLIVLLVGIGMGCSFVHWQWENRKYCLEQKNGGYYKGQVTWYQSQGVWRAKVFDP